MLVLEGWLKLGRIENRLRNRGLQVRVLPGVLEAAIKLRLVVTGLCPKTALAEPVAHRTEAVSRVPLALPVLAYYFLAQASCRGRGPPNVAIAFGKRFDKNEG